MRFWDMMPSDSRKIAGIGILILWAFAANASEDFEAKYEELADGKISGNDFLSFIQERFEHAPAYQLFLASAIAANDGDWEEAGYLFYVGQLKAIWDMKEFPPVGQGGNSPGVLIGALHSQIGMLVNPEINGRPVVFAKVANRLEQLASDRPDDYSPGWDYSERLNVTAASEMRRVEKERMMAFVHRNAKLLNDEVYFSGYQAVQAYYRLSFEEYSNEARREAVMQALESMAEAEKRLFGDSMFSDRMRGEFRQQY